MLLTPSHATAFIRYHHHFTMSSTFFCFYFFYFIYCLYSVLYYIYTRCLYQLKFLNYKAFIFHMIYSSAIWTGSLTNRVKASTAITTTNRCNGESRWFHVSSISPKCNVYTVSAPVDTAILLAVIYPPCPECHTQMTSLHMYILHCHSLHICHFYNIPKVWI